MWRRTVPPLLGVLIAAAAAGGCGSSSSSHSKSAGVTTRAVSGPLIGVTFDGPVLAPGVNLPQQIERAVASGVESLRVAVNWSQLQPTNAAPNLAELDALVAAAASKHLTLLPVVEYTPSWAASRRGNTAAPPRNNAAYAAFLTTLIGRYGPNGTFWSSHPQTPKIPIRMWQIWNEPHFVSYWTTQPFAPSYVALLQVAHDAIKAADPGGKVVLGGLADFSWQYLGQIYRVPGAGKLFDLVAIHPYTAQAPGVITILQRVRKVMDRHGDASKPILATEITWPSSEGKAPPQFGVGTTEPQQAKRIAQVMPLLHANETKLHLVGFYWYTWMGNETPSRHPYGFNFAGLEKYVGGSITVKPALSVFKQQALRLENCRAKTTATSC